MPPPTPVFQHPTYSISLKSRSWQSLRYRNELALGAPASPSSREQPRARGNSFAISRVNPRCIRFYRSECSEVSFQPLTDTIEPGIKRSAKRMGDISSDKSANAPSYPREGDLRAGPAMKFARSEQRDIDSRKREKFPNRATSLRVYDDKTVEWRSRESRNRTLHWTHDTSRRCLTIHGTLRPHCGRSVLFYDEA